MKHGGEKFSLTLSFASKKLGIELTGIETFSSPDQLQRVFTDGPKNFDPCSRGSVQPIVVLEGGQCEYSVWGPRPAAWPRARLLVFKQISNCRSSMTISAEEQFSDRHTDNIWQSWTTAGFVTPLPPPSTHHRRAPPNTEFAEVTR